jgi:hypothetical protein
MADAYIHYRFDINFTTLPDASYVIYDMFGYIRYNQTTRTIEKMNNGSPLLKYDDGTMIDQLYDLGTTIGTATSDNRLWKDHNKNFEFVTSPVYNPSHVPGYVDIADNPDFFFGTLILANTFITIYNKGDNTENVAQYWKVVSTVDNKINLQFTVGSSEYWQSIERHATYAINFNTVSNLNPSSPACFIEGTKILSYLNNKNAYVPIQNLRKGDLVKTHLHGYRKITHIGKNTLKNNPNKWNECVCVLPKVNKLGGFEELKITGAHSILVDNVSIKEKEAQTKLYGNVERKVDGKHLLTAWSSDHFRVLKDNNVYTYYHFVLEHEGDKETRYGVWANGVLTESQSEKHFNDKHYLPL